MSQLVAFAKHWQPGEAKTRLGAVIGMERAAEFQRWCVERVVLRLGGVTRRSSLWVSPAERIEAFRDLLLPGWELRSQVGGDLGERLERAFSQSFSRSEGPVIAIGTDTPELTPERIAEALRLLQEGDLVLGPAHDGGYYLIGLASPCREIFREMPWSSSVLTEVTLRRASELGLVTKSLPTMHDVDEYEDFVSLMARMAEDERARGDGSLAWLERLMGKVPRQRLSSQERLSSRAEERGSGAKGKDESEA